VVVLRATLPHPGWSDRPSAALRHPSDDHPEGSDEPGGRGIAAAMGGEATRECRYLMAGERRTKDANTPLSFIIHRRLLLEVERGEITAEGTTRKRPDLIASAVGCSVWSFSGRPDLKVKVRLIHRSSRFCITTTSILMGATYTRVRLIVEILR